MKNIFGLNKSLYSENGSEAFDGAQFISTSLSEENEEKEETSKKELPPALPLPLSVLQYVFVGLFAVATGIWISSGMSYSLMLKNAVHLPIMQAVGLVGFIIIAVFDSVRSKKFAKEHGIKTLTELEEYVELHDEDEDAEAAEEARVRAALKIPEDALDMDFLGFFYRVGENGAFPIKPFDFMTLEMFAYTDGEYLNVADYNDVYSIPLSSFTGIEKCEKETTLLGWSKDDSFDSETYAEYGITENKDGFLVIPYYYSAKLSAENEDGESEEFELLIPPYEYGSFIRLTGLSVTE